jgi:acetyl/propionyl-CoA carboxylase alpha subunit
MFSKVLVANRGEIAVRILRACRELGMSTAAVYSEADRSSLHVRYADEAYLLGPAPARESYLRGEKIIEIAKRCKAGAIHPGYGFLAEREDFARAVEDAGLIFIGPRPSAIAAMGDKAVARATVTAAGVPVVPGTEGEGDLRDEEIIAIAPKIGFPLLIRRPPEAVARACARLTGRSNCPTCCSRLAAKPSRPSAMATSTSRSC